ncbi:integral membrane protein [Hirsutella rhossiliensis]|uniref:Integral membrane protein n=1 Tax=Hirsutella rhossiliensis TaxID=111463 RepID=A0A9P8SDW4_9HYPO|nr:uncharacterized protein HRG_11573 [Hirsutella rhossiliensis]KAH0957426.1 integral membrane protein [Hirsutella rhossiliensis]
MPLFSSKRRNGADGDNERHQQHQRSGDDAASDQPPPDEHTRLLPNRVDSNRGMLRPDDPAVTPYNLWSIRILRYLTLLFTAVTLAWWVLLLVSAFVTPPGLHTPGGSFYAFGYASLALANMFFSLVFFGVPSKSVRVLAVVIAFFLLLDTIILLSVQQTRYEEGWVGIVSVIWALLMSLWTLLTDRTVKWGKEEEEERLTGRAETRRTLTEWLAVLLSTIAYVIMAVAVLLITLTVILRALDAGVAPPGKLYRVDSGKYRVHVHCHGNKTELPTVLFEGGERPVEEGLWGFADHAVKNGSIRRYCFVDRPGMAWSDNAPSPLSAGFAVDVVSEALAQADERGPWILASAGIGSIYSRVFSSRHGLEVQGLLLIDPLHEDLLGRVAAPGRGFLLWLRGVISPLGLDRLSGALFRGRSSRDRVYGRAAQQNSKFIYAKLQESLVANSFTRRDVQGSRMIQDKQTPLVVISSGIEVRDNDSWEGRQRDLTTLTDKLKHWDVVDEAPHRVWETLEGREQIERRLRQLVHA